MGGRGRFSRLVDLVTRRPLIVLAITAALALGGAALALRLEPAASTDTLVDRSSESFEQTERFKEDFGDDAVLVLVQGDLAGTVLSADLGRLLSLEGCLSGNVPPAELRKRVALNRRQPARGLPPVCEQLAELDPVRAVYGPGTFVNTAANEINAEIARRQRAAQRRAARAADAARELSARRGDPESEQQRLADAAAKAVIAQFTQDLFTLASSYGLSPTALPALDNAEFVSALVFKGEGSTAPKSRFAYLFPSDNAALVQARLRPDLSEAERKRAIELIEEAVAAPVFAPRNGGRYVVTGVPVVSDALASAVQDAIFVLLGAALLVMAATLAVVFRTRLRLLPLGLALAAAAMTFGALSLAGGSLTMASIAVLPVLIGLAVDYAIQFQARYDEEIAGGGLTPPAPPASEWPVGGTSGLTPPVPPAEAWPAAAFQSADRRSAAIAAAGAGGPTIATAGLATAVGFLVLLLSPVPMVRGFGLLLVAGIAIALACAVCAGFAALVRFGGRRPDPPPRGRRSAERGGSGGRVGEWIANRSWRALGVSLTHPRRVLAIGLAVAVTGIALDTQSDVVSDVTELMPQDLPALQDVRTLQEETGVSGEIDVVVRADDVARPEVVRWMADFQDEVLEAHGYRPGKSCAQDANPPELCPALSLPDLFETAAVTGATGADELLDAVPPYLSQGVVTRDRKTASIAFGIRLMPLDRQHAVVEDIEARLDPPPGVEAAVVGVPVLAAQANAALSSPWRRALTLLAALAGVLLVLLAVRRSLRGAAVPLIPIALAVGWSGGVVFLLGLLPEPLEVELNPMSVTLGALVIAISTEFSVLLSARYEQERAAGAGPARAVERAYASTGAAVLASGATAIAGFAALIFSDIRMLRDFGIVTVVDLAVSLLGVMLVLPAALVWAEQRRRVRTHA